MKRIALLVTLALPAVAHADDSNFRPYILGGQAAGMGGAYTALADDGTGAYYNPGGLAFSTHSSLSLSASVYGLITGSEANVLGQGHDFNFSDINTFPVSTAIVRKFGARDTPDGSQNTSLGFAVFVPDAIQIDDRDHAGSMQNAFFLSGISQTVWAGATYSRRIGNLGIGVSAFGLLGSEIEFLDLTEASNASNYLTITSRIDKSVKGAVLAAGIRYDASDNLRLGLSVYSPEVGWGSRRIFTRVTTASDGMTPQIFEQTDDNLSSSPNLPIRIQGGVAWTDKVWTFAADAIFLGRRVVTDNLDMAAQGDDQTIIRNNVLDGSVGMEYMAGGSVPIRFGLFTDFAQAPEPVFHTPGMADPNPSNDAHVDRYGGTLSVGFRTEHTETDVGLIISYGSGKADDPNLASDDPTTAEPTIATQLYSYIFITSSYAF
ncbi:MAG TPA: hypothetical protein VLX92_29395 [Kofleriaceae bacterium]|nr:hypothetical protein [Kofleriaceae bacterium]